MRNAMKKKLLSLLFVLMLFLCSCGSGSDSLAGSRPGSLVFGEGSSNGEFSYDQVPEYDGQPYAVINNNVPYFKESDFSEESFEQYSELDELGRCGTAFANVGIDLMPTEGRGNIGQVKPSGWQSVKYDFVDGKYLYNRCHLIGFQLTAENANKKPSGGSGNKPGAPVISGGNGYLSNPCPAGRITSEFGPREAPVPGASTFHEGRDYGAPIGTPIYAAAEGTVIRTGNQAVRGNYVVIRHPNGLTTWYQHCTDIFVSKGQKVSRGQNIATVGKTGRVSGPHLHFIVEEASGELVDPRKYL